MSGAGAGAGAGSGGSCAKFVRGGACFKDVPCARTGAMYLQCREEVWRSVFLQYLGADELELSTHVTTVECGVGIGSMDALPPQPNEKTGALES